MLGVVIPYFNPFGNEIRRKNTLDFLNYLEASEDVEYVLVEASHNSTWLFNSSQPFRRMIAHLKLPVKSLLWRKENLINIGARLLPKDLEAIAWIDADIEFLSDNWAAITLAALENVDIVQMFEMAAMLGPNNKPESLAFGAVNFLHNSGTYIRPPNKNGFGLTGHPGLAWAMRRSLFDKIGGLFEYSIVGDGDMDIIYALNLVSKYRIIHRSVQHILELDKWAEKVYGFKVSYVPLSVLHNWHGAIETRQYVDRKKILMDEHYNPELDICKENGLIELTERGLRLQKPIEDFFRLYS